MTDVGSGPSVADALLSDDPELAEEAVLDWAAALASLHAATLGAGELFAAELARRAGELPVAVDSMAGSLDGAAGILETHAVEVGVAMPVGLREELAELARHLDGGDHGALSPSDACPDNNVRDDTGLLSLVDFEGAAFRHVAWGVAYLQVPWPSCWCSWQIPADLTRGAIERYQAAMAPVLPWVRTDEFDSALANATLAWAVISTEWFLASALGGDPPLSDPTKIAPTRRAVPGPPGPGDTTGRASWPPNRGGRRPGLACSPPAALGTPAAGRRSSVPLTPGQPKASGRGSPTGASVDGLDPHGDRIKVPGASRELRR